MHTTHKQLVFLGVIAFTLLFSCKRWDDRVHVTDATANENLMEVIDSHPELSSFSSYLKKTGLDKVISASREYTVWAPDNDALASLGADTLADTALLRTVLMNHISQGLYLSANLEDSTRIPMINGKRYAYHNHTLSGAPIRQDDIRVRNGALQILSGYLPPRPSIWEYLNATKSTYLQSAFVTSLNYLSQDPALAVVDSINSVTGEPVYRPGTGIVVTNMYLSKVADLANEDSIFTYVILTNSAYQSARDRQKPYFKSSDPAITDTNACWNVVKDLAFSGMVLPSELPDSLLSRFNVHVPMPSSAILETRMMSNGIVYVINSAECRMDEKIPVCYVQGETPLGFSKSGDDFMARIFYRQRRNELTGLPFSDIYLNLGSGGANTFVDYTTNGLYTTTYKVYWVALNDMVASGQGDDTYGTDLPLEQILEIGQVKDSMFRIDFNVQQDVPPNDYSEVYLGEYTNSDFDWLLPRPLITPDGSNYLINPATRRLRLQAPAKSSTGAPLNLTVDYIKLVPETK